MSVKKTWLAVPALAQAPVTGAADPESLFTSPDPTLHANKQVVVHIVRDLLEANHWELADRYFTKDEHWDPATIEAR